MEDSNPREPALQNIATNQINTRVIHHPQPPPQHLRRQQTPHLSSPSPKSEQTLPLRFPHLRLYPIPQRLRLRHDDKNLLSNLTTSLGRTLFQTNAN